MRIWLLTPLMLALAGTSAWQGARAEVMGCLVEPDRVADVGSQSIGVLEHMMVERGDKVVAGQVMARLAAQVERASVSVAEARSTAEAEVSQAVAAHQLAQRKLERARDLLKQEFVSSQAVDQAEAEARVAEQRVAQARESQRVAHRELRLSAAQLSQREVRSPFGGIVVERYRTEGERIEREPVVRVARIDPLRVEAIVPASHYGRISAGQQATVRTELPAFSTLRAQVVLVDRVIDPASNSFRVRLTLPNPDHRIPPGLRCKLDFVDAGAPAPAAGNDAKVAPASAAREVSGPGGVPAIERVRVPAGAGVPRPAVRPSARGILSSVVLPTARGSEEAGAPGNLVPHPAPATRSPEGRRLALTSSLPRPPLPAAIAAEPPSRGAGLPNS